MFTFRRVNTRLLEWTSQSDLSLSWVCSFTATCFSSSLASDVFRVGSGLSSKTCMYLSPGEIAGIFWDFTAHLSSCGTIGYLSLLYRPAAQLLGCWEFAFHSWHLPYLIFLKKESSWNISPLVRSLERKSFIIYCESLASRRIYISRTIFPL